MKAIKLEIDMIPATTCYENLRKHMSQWEWIKLGNLVKEKANHTCEICGTKKGEGISYLHCHEVWDYDFVHNVQKLVQLQAVCFLCHNFIHFGYATSQDWIEIDEVITHSLKVNEMDPDQLEHAKVQAIETWKERSKIQWEVDYGEFACYLGRGLQTQEEKEQEKRLKEQEIFNQVYALIQDNRKITNEKIRAYLGISTRLTMKIARDVRKEIERQRIRKIFS